MDVWIGPSRGEVDVDAHAGSGCHGEASNAGKQPAAPHRRRHRRRRQSPGGGVGAVGGGDTVRGASETGSKGAGANGAVGESVGTSGGGEGQGSDKHTHHNDEAEEDEGGGRKVAAGENDAQDDSEGDDDDDELDVDSACRSGQLPQDTPANERVGLNEVPAKHSCILLYASTMRWMEQLESAFDVTTRPIKRGPLYTNGLRWTVQRRAQWEPEVMRASSPELAMQTATARSQHREPSTGDSNGNESAARQNASTQQQQQQQQQ